MFLVGYYGSWISEIDLLSDPLGSWILHPGNVMMSCGSWILSSRFAVGTCVNLCGTCVDLGSCCLATAHVWPLGLRRLILEAVSP